MRGTVRGVIFRLGWIVDELDVNMHLLSFLMSTQPKAIFGVRESL